MINKGCLIQSKDGIAVVYACFPGVCCGLNRWGGEGALVVLQPNYVPMAGQRKPSGFGFGTFGLL